MLPLTYHPGSAQPRRLPNPTQARGYQSGFSPLGGTVFGGAFVAAGTLMILVGLRIIEAGGRLHVPHWVMIPLGAVFALAGLFVWGQTWRHQLVEHRRERIMRRHPDEPALADHDWDPTGSRSALRSQALRATLIAIFFTLFLTPMNYLVFRDHQAPWFARAGLVFFDFVTVYLIGAMIVSWSRVIKFGQAVLRFANFPLRTNEPVRLTWVAPAGCSGAATGGFTLRSIAEWHETTGAGKSRNRRLVHEQRWSGSWRLESPVMLTPGMTCELECTLPADARGTALHAERPQFWQLDVELQLPGLDFKDTYLVPIYGPRRDQ